MTLQDRVLEALGAHGLTPKQLYDRMATDSAAAVDFAIRGLVRDGRIALIGGCYQRAGVAAEHVVMEGDNVLSAVQVEGGVVVGGVIAPAAPQPAMAATASSAPATTLTRKCRRCQLPKPLTDFPRRGPSTTARITTCQACVDYENERALKAKAAKQALSLPGVTELVEKVERRRAATFSPDLVCRLIERQAQAAKALQVACDLVQVRRQELLDIEELVRIATTKRGAALEGNN